MTEKKKNPVLEQMESLENQLSWGMVSGQDIVQHVFDTTVASADPLATSENEDLLGLMIATENLIKIAREEADSLTIDDVLGAIDMVVKAYAHKRDQCIRQYLQSREITMSLLETADMHYNGKKLH